MLAESLLQALQSLLAYRVGRVILEICGRGAGASAVDETEALIETEFGDQLHRGIEILLALAGEADDKVR